MAKKQFGLYVVRPEDIGEKEKYFLITPSWTLLYTNRKPPALNVEVTDLSNLPSLASEWLNDTINQIRIEYLQENAETILKNGKMFNERFEAELKAEQSRLSAEVAQDG